MNARERLQECKGLFDQGRYFECATVLAAAVQAAADAGSDLCGEERASICIEHARIQTKLAHYDESQRALAQAQEILEKENQEQSFLYSEFLHELGKLAYEQDRMEDAKKAYKDALQIRRALFAGAHNGTAKVLQSLGEASWSQGDYNTADAYLDEALQMQGATIGEEHEDYADTLADTGLVKMGLGRLEESEAVLRKALAIKEARLPADHAWIGSDLANLAHVIGMRRRDDENIESMIKRAIDITARAYGEDNPRTAICVNNLGGYHLDRGNLLEAQKHFERALGIKERTLGKQSPGLIKQLNNLEIVYAHLNKKSEAQVLRERAQSLMNERIDATDSKDLDTMILLADKLSAGKKHGEARAILDKALTVATEEFGADSLRAALVLQFIGVGALNAGNAEEAGRFFLRVLHIRRKHLGKKHAQVAETLRQVSLCLQMQHMPDIAELVSQQARAIEKAAGIEDPQIAAMQARFNQLRDLKGANDPAVIQNLRMLAEMYRLRGDAEKAEEYYDQYLAACETEEGPDSLDLAHELVLRATTMRPMHSFLSLSARDSVDIDEEELMQGIGYLEKAVAIQKRAIGESPENDDLVSTLGQLAEAYALLQNYERAESIANEQIALVERTHGPSHWAMAAPLNTLKSILELQDRTKEAAAIEERRKNLPEATREERDANQSKIMERMFGAMSKMLTGLTALSQEEDDAGSEADT